ncbi:HTH-type transcriptional regulator DmlR [Acaryochloris thomasi RCC1774]|uniref:HTH-type transcriptional regulator DmlR n=1 Tax=Acaryochloris thomasi RCC1774 TaxID=1764569 RepID=A0A2W1JJ13_9CYAN|nr:LysR family transcriptional regulator [Acaryochloris thomasi]PZD73236.1 HTH-type transcriptional regulator DmlR [Acaryochloris thomasi RCC1774]
MSKSLDRLTLLETFVRIADAGSISAAARDLDLSQPSVSRQLAELESRFKSQLMRRTTHDLSLTTAGAELLADARQLLDEWEALEEKHLETEETLRGKLKVVVPVALGQLYLLDTVLQFQHQHPHIALSWQLEDQNIRFAEVGCDCWIKIGSVPDESLIVEPLGQVERMAVATPELFEIYGRPKTPADLEKLPCVALEPFEGGHIPLTHAKGKTVTVSPPIRMTTNNISAVRKATLAGLGLAILPRWLIEDELNKHQLVDLLPLWRAPKLTICVASLPGRHRPRRLQSFLDILKVTVPKIPGVEPLSHKVVHRRDFRA